MVAIFLELSFLVCVCVCVFFCFFGGGGDLYWLTDQDLICFCVCVCETLMFVIVWVLLYVFFILVSYCYLCCFFLNHQSVACQTSWLICLGMVIPLHAFHLGDGINALNGCLLKEIAPPLLRVHSCLPGSLSVSDTFFGLHK